MRVLIWVVLLAGLLASVDAHAIPPFARRYGFACSTCHVGGPTKLNPFGEAFRDNGYRIPGDDAAYVQQPAIPLGDPRRSILFPSRAIWPGELPAFAPVGVSGTAGVTATWPRGAATEAKTLEAVANAKILLGGSIGAHFSIFGVLEGGTDGIALDQLHLVARSLFDRWIGEQTLSLKVGRFELDVFQFQPGLYRSSDGSGVPLELQLAVGQDGFSLAEPKEALEIYGLIAGRVKWLVGVANGQKPIDDFTTRRDYFARVSAKLGGVRLDYKNVTPDVSDTTSVVIGASAYVGRGVAVPGPVPSQIPGLAPTQPPRFKNDIYRLFFDARLRTTHDFDLYGQLYLGQDSNPDGDSTVVRHLGWLAGIDVSIMPWLQPYVRYEEIYFDTATHADHRRLLVGLAAFVRTNLRLRVQGIAALSEADAHVLMTELFYAM